MKNAKFNAKDIVQSLRDIKKTLNSLLTYTPAIRPIDAQINQFMKETGLAALEEKLRGLGSKELSVQEMAQHLGITPQAMERKLQVLEKLKAMNDVLGGVMDKGLDLLPWIKEHQEELFGLTYPLSDKEGNIKTISDLMNLLHEQLVPPAFIAVLLKTPSIDGDHNKITAIKEGVQAARELKDHETLDLKFEKIKQGFQDLKTVMDEAKELPELQEMKALNDKLKAGGSLSRDEIERMRELAQDPDLVKVLRNMQEKERNISKISDFDFHILLKTYPERKSELQAIAEQFKPLTQELEEQYPEPADLRFLLRKIENALEKDQAPFKIGPLQGYNSSAWNKLESILGPKPDEAPASGEPRIPKGHHHILPVPEGPGQ